MRKLSANAITGHLAATFAGLPVVRTIEHADGVVLVDTGMLDSTLDEEGAPVPMPENIPRNVVCVINTFRFDHCGGNRLFPGVPIHVQRLELQGPHDPHEWVDFQVGPTSSTTARQVLPRHPAAADARPHKRPQSLSTRPTGSSSSAATSRTATATNSGAARPTDNGACSL